MSTLDQTDLLVMFFSNGFGIPYLQMVFQRLSFEQMLSENGTASVVADSREFGSYDAVLP